MSSSPYAPPSQNRAYDELQRNLRRGSETKRFEESLVDLVDRRWEAGRQRRAPYLRDWLLNLNFYAGNQNVFWDSDDQCFRLRTQQRPSWSSTVVENRVQGLVRAAVGVMIGNKPEYTCVPAHASEEDKTAAQLGDSIIKRAWKSFGLRKTQTEVALWMLIASMSGLRVHWDPNIGPLTPAMDTDETGRVMYDEANRPMTRRDRRGNVLWDHQGDVAWTIIPPINFLPGDYCSDPRHLPWYIYEVPRSLEHIRMKWPETGKKVAAEEIGSDPLGQGHLSAAYFSFRGAQETDPSDDEPAAVVKEMVTMPSEEFPLGGVCHVANGILLDFHDGLDEYCLATSTMGLTIARCFPVPGRFWPCAAVDLLVPLQRELNRTRRQVTEAKDQTCAPKYLIPRSANVRKGSLNRRPGERVPYDYPFVPTLLVPPPLPRYILEWGMKLPYWMQEVMGLHQATLGQAPQNLRSGLAINQVQEQDEVGWMIPSQEIEDMFEAGFGRFLWLVQQNYSESRTVRSLSEDTGEWDIQEFTGADLKGVVDVECVEGSMTRRSKTQIRAFLLEILQTQAGMALMADPRMIVRILESFDLGHIGEYFNAWRLDAAQARREFKTLRAHPQTIPVTEYENSWVHLKVHGDALKSAKSLRYPPRVRQEMVRHFVYTQRKLLLEAQAQEDQEAESQGAQKKAS
jgi:hypothetical protein